MNFWKFWVRKFYKMNPELYEFLEIWRTGILKNESRNFTNFLKFCLLDFFFKMNPEFYEFLEIWCTGIFKK